MKLIHKIQKFMIGRYGIDELYQALFKVYLVALVFDLFLNHIFLTSLELLLIFIMFYRAFSKNIPARRKENAAYLKFKKKLFLPFVNIKRNIQDKEHIYKRCPKCKTVLMLPLPRKRGIKRATCPHCKHSVRVLALKREKIEIIKDNERITI